MTRRVESFAAPRVAIVGAVPPGPSGVHDYGRILGQELSRRGVDVEELWAVNDERTIGSALSASARLIRWALSAPQDVTVLWQYSSFAYAARGIPLFGVALGVVLRLRRRRVVTFVHELAYPWGPRGWRGRVISASQWLSLRIVLAGSDAAIVTMRQRADAVRRRMRRSSRTEVRVVPVFSTLGEPRPRSEHEDGRVLGVIDYSGDGAKPELLFEAVGGRPDLPPLHVVCLGAPGATSPDARRWVALATTAGLGDVLEFTGVVPAEELSARIASCSVVTLLNEEGPSSRRTMLAAALAHGCAVVAVDGPGRSEELVLDGALVVVPPDPDALGAAFARLLNDRQERVALGARALSAYERLMSVQRAGDAVWPLLSSSARSVRSGASSTSVS